MDGVPNVHITAANIIPDVIVDILGLSIVQMVVPSVIVRVINDNTRTPLRLQDRDFIHSYV